MLNYSLFGSQTLKNPRYTGNNKISEYTKTKFKYQGLSSLELDDSYFRSCALKLADDGNYTEAIALLNQLINHNPHNAIDYNNRGLIFFKNGNHEKALNDYNRAIELNPKLASIYNNRANCYAASGDLMAALSDYDLALDLNPHYVRAWINRGITLRDLGKYQEAIDNFEIALLFGQLETNIWAERGRTYHIWGEWNCAMADYNRALLSLNNQENQPSFSSYRLQLQVENWLNQLISPQGTDL